MVTPLAMMSVLVLAILVSFCSPSASSPASCCRRRGLDLPGSAPPFRARSVLPQRTNPARTSRHIKASKRPLRSGFYAPHVCQDGPDGDSRWVCYFGLGSVNASSAVRQLCSILALAAALTATDIGAAQPFDPVARDIRTGVYRGHVVTYEVIDGLAIWDGDIILGTPEELSPENVVAPGNPPDYRNKISVISSKESLWPGGIIPYVIDPELENPHVPLAIQHWNENTVIRLVERTDQPNWIRFTPDSGCRSYVGMIGGEQDVFLSEYCNTNDVVHEIGHVIGLWHEHERSDRDSHVWARSHPLGRVDGFFYYGKDGPYAVASGPYDYGSVMHYRLIGPVETIPPGIALARGGPHLGGVILENAGLSAGDIDGVSRLYGKIPTKTTVATNVAGLLIEVDGETYTAPHSFDWEPGSIHTISGASPQKLRIDYYRYLFAHWSDGGAQTHSVTASSETTVFIANFIRQMRPTPSARPPEGGTVRFDPPSPGGFYPRSSLIKAIAKPAEGFSFERWIPWFLPLGGGYSSNPVLSSVAQRYPALFTRRPLTTIDTNIPGSRVLVDGIPIILPASFSWEPGSTHSLGFDGNVGEVQIAPGVGRLKFNGWSDGGGATHDITVSEGPATISANFMRQFFVETVSHGPGTIEVQPSGSEGRYHDTSTTVQLTARPAPGFKFVSWLVDLSGTENPQSLHLDSFKWVRAYFLDEQSFESAKLTSGKPFNLLSGPGSSLPEGYNGYWILVPPGATQLDIRLVTTTPGANVALYANRDVHPSAVFDENTNDLIGYESQYSATGPGGDKTITITPESNPRLEPGLYFIAVHVRTKGVRVSSTLTADVTVSDEEIAANIPHFGIPASLITTREGELSAPQILEVRNSGRGTLDYQITTDQPWLSVSPDRGSAMEETDIIEIRADPMAMEPGAFEGTITITESQPAVGLATLFSKSSPPAWPVTVPVTLIVIPEDEEDTPLNPPADPFITDTAAGDGGPAVEARLLLPSGVDADTAGNLYIADSGNRRVRRVDTSGIITTIAGDSAPLVEDRLVSPNDVTVDAAGSLYIADTFIHRIRRVDPSGTVFAFAGTGEEGFSGDGGPAVQAQLNFPGGVAVDASGNLYIADAANNRIRRVDPSRHNLHLRRRGRCFGGRRPGGSGPAGQPL